MEMSQMAISPKNAIIKLLTENLKTLTKNSISDSSSRVQINTVKPKKAKPKRGAVSSKN